MKKKDQNSKKEKGQALIEFSLSLIIMMILLAGTIDIGRAFFAYMVLRDAAQEGASYGSVARTAQADTIPCVDIENRVRSTSTNPVDLQSNDIQVDVSFSGLECSAAAVTAACFGRDVEVNVSYTNFPLVTPFLGAIIGRQTIPISATVVDTVLTPPCD
jgi:Flp pilus assembly protein TadG